MSWLMNVPPFARGLRAVQARAHAVWSRDRATLRGFPAIANRAFRIVILAVRGILKHRIGLQAAALTYYTVFAMVPMLVVLLWILKAADKLPLIAQRLPRRVAAPSGDQLLNVALRMILEAVDQTSEIASGVVGLVALLFAVSKMFAYTERALHIIASSGQRTPKWSRALAYVALLLMPPVALAISGVVLALVRRSADDPLSRLLRAIPGVDVALGIALAFGALWLAVTLLYTAAARARIPFVSAAVGGGLAAVALPVIFWVFANFQIGVSHASAISSGFFAFPVFLLWVFSSWCAVLVGAEIAVAHRVDRVLVHGVSTFRLDSVGERRAGVAIMLQLTRMGALGERGAVTEDDLARELRLTPAVVRDLCFRLVQRGLLAEDVRGFSLVGDPDRLTFDAVADAIDRDPRIDVFSPPLADDRTLDEGGTPLRSG
jgi:membrane protein